MNSRFARVSMARGGNKYHPTPKQKLYRITSKRHNCALRFLRENIH